MEKIERRPLPPPNSTATKITEADRSEMLAQANEVIDHYVNGPGSYWDAGTRKPLQETMRDLNNFKSQIIASKQFADDPNSVMDSIIDLIERTKEQVEQADRNREGKDGRIEKPPETNDPIDDPRVISPIQLNNGILPISRHLTRRGPIFAVTSPVGEDANTADRRLARYPGSRISGMSVPPGSPAGGTAPPLVPLDENVDPRRAGIGDRSGGLNTTAPAAASRSSSQLQAPLLGLVSGKPMAFYPDPPPIFGFPEPAAPDDEDWLMQLLVPRGRK